MGDLRRGSFKVPWGRPSAKFCHTSQLRDSTACCKFHIIPTSAATGLVEHAATHQCCTTTMMVNEYAHFVDGLQRVSNEVCTCTGHFQMHEVHDNVQEGSSWLKCARWGAYYPM